MIEVRDRDEIHAHAWGKGQTMDESELVPIGFVAKLLGISTKRVGDYADRGDLRVFRDPATGRRFFRKKEVLDLFASRRVPDDGVVKDR